MIMIVNDGIADIKGKTGRRENVLSVDKGGIHLYTVNIYTCEGKIYNKVWEKGSMRESL